MHLRWVFRYRYLLALGWLGLSLTLLPWAGPALQPNNALQVWFLESDPALRTYRTFQQHFGNDEYVILALDYGDSLFTPAGLRQLHAIDSLVARVPGIVKVEGLPHLQLAWPVPGGLTAQPLLPPHPPQPTAAGRLYARW
ncbi:MAG: hypothetical protein D6722_24995 [Bacteroidetes bacterium]|nr:MAG: hypothetical protein D6722_24995 [Bacteroidota bacterium]